MKSYKLLLLAGVALSAAGLNAPALAQSNPLDLLTMDADAVAQLDPAFRLEMARQAVTAAEAELERVRAAGGDVAAAAAQLKEARAALAAAEAAAAAEQPPAEVPAPGAVPAPAEAPAEPPPAPPVEAPAEPPPPQEPPAAAQEPAPLPPEPPAEPPPVPPGLLDVLPPGVGDLLQPGQPPAAPEAQPAPVEAPPAGADQSPPPPEAAPQAPEGAGLTPLPEPPPGGLVAPVVPPIPSADAVPPAEAPPEAPAAAPAQANAPAADAAPQAAEGAPASPLSIDPQVLQGPAGELLERLFAGQPPPPPPPPPPPLPPEEQVMPEAAAGEQVVGQEGTRIIIQLQNNQFAVRNNDEDRFRYSGETLDTQTLPNGNIVATSTRVDGTKVITLYDPQGNILRRVRQNPDGTEVQLIGLPPELDRDQDGVLDNPPPSYANAPPVGGPVYNYDSYLPPLVVPIPQEQYVVNLDTATPEAVGQAIFAPPVEQVERPYSLEEIRFSERIRDKVVRIDLDTITFATNSAEVGIDQIDELEYIGYYMAQAIQANPASLFLVEGHTDAIGTNAYNLLLSDRRAERVAVILSQYMGIPPENMVTQGYGEEYLKVPTLAAEQANRRVTIRNITELVQGGRLASAAPPPPPSTPIPPAPPMAPVP